MSQYQCYTKTKMDTLLGGKQDTLTAGTGISIDANNVISATGGGGGGADNDGWILCQITNDPVDDDSTSDVHNWNYYFTENQDEFTINTSIVEAIQFRIIPVGSGTLVNYTCQECVTYLTKPSVGSGLWDTTGIAVGPSYVTNNGGTYINAEENIPLSRIFTQDIDTGAHIVSANAISSDFYGLKYSSNTVSLTDSINDSDAHSEYEFLMNCDEYGSGETNTGSSVTLPSQYAGPGGLIRMYYRPAPPSD